MPDRFSSTATGRESPGMRHNTITPGAAALDPRPRVLYVLVTGDLQITDETGVTMIYTSVPVGVFPFSPTHVLAGTTATVIGWD